jgi:hypothetical protein
MANPLTLSSDSRSVDQSVAPYIRAREVAFNGYSLKSGAQAYFYFDDKKVDNYVQSPSTITITTTDAIKFAPGTGLYCNSTGAYCSVLGVSPNTKIYVSENYLTLNVVAYGVEALGFTRGDLVYQATGTTQSSITFLGRVDYWNSTDRKLAIVPEKGTINTSMIVLNALGKTNRCNISSIVGNEGTNKFPVSSTLTAIIDGTACTAQTAIISAYNHRSGIIPRIPASASTITLAGPTESWMVGNTLYITSGSGIGLSGTISSVTANTVSLSTPLSFLPTGNTRYSIGYPVSSTSSTTTVDNNGIICGIFNIPETPTVKFLTGERIFAITDNNSYADDAVSSSAVAKYSSVGFLNLGNEQQTPTVSPTPPARPTPNVTVNVDRTRERERRRDPVAQTFFTPDPKSVSKNYGIFVTSIDIWFSKKPPANSIKYPIEIRLVEVVNGLPTERIIESTTVLWRNVNVAATTPNSTNKTKFTFPDPVYLLPSREYAFVVISDSPDYRVWHSVLGQNDKTKSPSPRIDRQPYSGSMFLSQNGSTWTPIQNWDMMFQINKAQFSSGFASATFDVLAKDIPILVDEVLIQSSDLQFPSGSLNYSVRGTYASTLSQDTGTTVVPQTLYKYGKDLTTSSLNSNRRRIVREGNNKSMVLTVTMSSSDPDVSPIINKERISAILRSNYINSGGLYSGDISITDGGSHVNSSNIVVTFSSPDLTGGIRTTANVLPSQLVGGKVTGLNILVNGSGYSTTPNVTIVEAAASSNATAIVRGETSSSDGNSYARYQTRKVSLADGFEAGDLRVYVECVRPSGTHVLAYYKVLSPYDSDEFLDKNWVKMAVVKDINSPDQQTGIELEFVPSLFSESNSIYPGEPTGQLSYVVGEETFPVQGVFKHFAIKLVMFANDPTVSPVIRSMRAIATEGEFPGGTT